MNQLTSQTYPNKLARWQAFKRGDRVAFEQLYALNSQLLIKYGYKITTNRALIQDCIQDLFVELWESRRRLADTDSVKFYLLKSLRYKLLRQLQNTATVSLNDMPLPRPDKTLDTPLTDQETLSERTRQLKQVLAQLPKRQQEAIHLRYFQELSNEEIAEVMGINYQSACKFIYTALSALREKLQLSCLIPLLPALAYLGRYVAGN